MALPKLSYNNKQEYCVHDFETEGLNLYLSRPWQLAYGIYKGGKEIYTVERYPYFPDLNVSKGAAKVTGFSYEKYRDLATPAEDVAEEFLSVVYNPKILLVGHNCIGFDIFILKILAKLTGKWKGWSFMDRTIDTLCLSRAYNNGEKLDTNNFLTSQMKYIGKPAPGSKKATLGAMCKEFKIDVDPDQQHNAVYDIGLTAKIFEKLKYELEL